MAKHVFRLTYSQRFRGGETLPSETDTLVARDAGEACDKLSVKATNEASEGCPCAGITILSVEHVAELTC